MPNTVNRALTTPNTGDMVGTWGTTAVNPNMQVIDGILGGVVSVSLTNTNVSLTISTGVIGTGSLTPGAGPVQADNAVVKFTGTLTGNCVITFPCPGFWIVRNNCTVGAFYVTARANGTGNVIGLPPGRAVKIWNDGTDADFCDAPEVASYLDLAVSTTPAWMSACTVKPYLICDGSTYTSSSFPALNAVLGSTFGGNGVTTFAVPDLGNRMRVALGGGRITTTGGLDGATLGASGGVQTRTISTSNLPASIPYTDPGHTHAIHVDANDQATGGGSSALTVAHPAAAGKAVSLGNTDSQGTFITINPGSPNTALGIIPPALVAGLTFIKT